MVSPLLSKDMSVERLPGFVEAMIDNEVVALNIETGMCYGLNKVGSRVWALIENPGRISDICTTLVSEFEVEPAVCEREVLDLLEDLRAEGMIATLEEK